MLPKEERGSNEVSKAKREIIKSVRRTRLAVH